VGAGQSVRSQRPRGKTATDRVQETQLADIASLYYVDRLTQEEIARQIGRSVATVSRLLARAEASDIVEVRVRHPAPLAPALQAALVARFGLRVARVVRASPDEPHTVFPQISDLAARHIATLLADGMVVVVSGGSTVGEVVRVIPSGVFRDLHVVQGLGSLGGRLPEFDNPIATRRLAERLNATAHLLPAPMIVETPSVRDALVQDLHFREPLELSADADIAIVGIGPADPELSILCRAGYLNPWDMEQIRAIGGVGDIMAEFFDIHGRLLSTDIGSRVVGMRREAIAAARTVVAVASGLMKAPAILGALRTGLIDVLATDDATARRVLELADANPIPAEAAGGETRGSPAESPALSDRATDQRDAILEATLEALGRNGYQSLAIGAIAARVGVDRQLLYRRWPGKAELAIEACDHAARQALTRHDMLSHDLAAILQAIALSRLGDPAAVRIVYRTMMAEAQTDPPFRARFLAWHDEWRDLLVNALQRGVARGELRGNADARALATSLLGALWYRLLLEDTPIDEMAVGGLIATILGTALPQRLVAGAR
jgi:DNA-binding transcriptional regulator LsrR (DeoR family)/AcrR family transcriptional regulator